MLIGMSKKPPSFGKHPSLKNKQATRMKSKRGGQASTPASRMDPTISKMISSGKVRISFKVSPPSQKERGSSEVKFFQVVNHVDVFSLARGLVAEFDKSQARSKIFPPDVLVNLRGVGKAIDTGNDSRSDSVVFVDKLFAVRLKNKPLVAEVSESREFIAIVRLAETVADGSGDETALIFRNFVAETKCLFEPSSSVL